MLVCLSFDFEYKKIRALVLREFMIETIITAVLFVPISMSTIADVRSSGQTRLVPVRWCGVL
jgi:hypothetical protein